MGRIRAQVVNVSIFEREGWKTYVEAFNKARDLKVVAKYWGERAAILASFVHVIGTPADDPFYVGEIACFTDFNTSQKWIDLKKAKEASQERVEKLAAETENFRPDYKKVDFLFGAKKHRLFVKQPGLTGSTTAIIVRHWLADPRIAGPGVQTTAEPSTEALDTVLGLTRLRRLTIVIGRPNSDHPALEKDFEERLQKMNAKTLGTNLVAVEGETLKPDERIKEEAEVAMSNGYVEAEGRDEHDLPTHRSTAKFPLERGITFDSKKEKKMQAFLRLAKELLSIIKELR
jgi:hypothetical protein